MKSKTLKAIIDGHVEPDSIVYSDTLSSYNVLDVSDFKHYRINHSKRFGKEKNHINGIENFWNQAKRHMRRFNGIPATHFPALPQGMRVAIQYSSSKTTTNPTNSMV